MEVYDGNMLELLVVESGSYTVTFVVLLLRSGTLTVAGCAVVRYKVEN